MYTLKINLKDYLDCSNLRENILNDYELIKSIYLDNFDEVQHNNYEDTKLNKVDKISFKLNLKVEMEVDSTLIELIEILKFSDILINSHTIGLPYWIKFTCDIKSKILEIKFFLFWIKNNSTFYENLSENIIKNLNQDSLFFTIVEDYKNLIQLPDKKVLINWLQQMKEELVIQKGEISIYEIIYNKDNQKSENTEKFSCLEYDDTEIDNLSLLKARSNKILENSKQKKEKIQNENINYSAGKSQNNEHQYDQFINDGGIVGEIITDRGSTFQAHAIRISCFNDVNKYITKLKSNNKIFKATHNILAYRVLDSNKNNQDKNKIVNKSCKNTSNGELNVTQGFDDDGEDGAGIRLLGILEKMKICNMMVVVSRWFGGTLLGNDRFKHINDAAKNLINKNKNNFDFMN